MRIRRHRDELVPRGGAGAPGGADSLRVGVLAFRPGAPGGGPGAGRHRPGAGHPVPRRRVPRTPAGVDGRGAGRVVQRRLGGLRALPGALAMTGVISVVLLVAGLAVVLGSCAGMAVLDDPLDRLHLTTPAAMLGSIGIWAPGGGRVGLLAAGHARLRGA